MLQSSSLTVLENYTERGTPAVVFGLCVIHSKTICGEPQLRNKITDECLSPANALRPYCTSNLWIGLLILVEYSREVRTDFSQHQFFPYENKCMLCKVSCFSFQYQLWKVLGHSGISNWATQRCFEIKWWHLQSQLQCWNMGWRWWEVDWLKKWEIQEYQCPHSSKMGDLVLR